MIASVVSQGSGTRAAPDTGKDLFVEEVPLAQRLQGWSKMENPQEPSQKRGLCRWSRIAHVIALLLLLFFYTPVVTSRVVMFFTPGRSPDTPRRAWERRLETASGWCDGWSAVRCPKKGIGGRKPQFCGFTLADKGLQVYKLQEYISFKRPWPCLLR